MMCYCLVKSMAQPFLSLPSSSARLGPFFLSYSQDHGTSLFTLLSSFVYLSASPKWVRFCQISSSVGNSLFSLFAQPKMGLILSPLWANAQLALLISHLVFCLTSFFTQLGLFTPSRGPASALGGPFPFAITSP